MKIDPKRIYCVYAHSINGDVFYIGAGLIERAFTQNGRSRLWQYIVDRSPYYDVSIISTHETQTSAMRVESAYIFDKKPIANYQNNDIANMNVVPFFDSRSNHIHGMIIEYGGYSKFVKDARVKHGISLTHSLLLRAVLDGKIPECCDVLFDKL